MTKRLIIVGIIIAVFLGGLAYFQLVFKPQMIEQFVSQMQKTVSTVTTEKAKTESWISTIDAIGTVAAIRGVNLAPEIAGIVEAYSFDSGDDVKAGTLLVQLDDSVQQAELLSNKATLKDAELDFDRQRQLVNRGAVSQAQLDTATARRDSAAAAVQQVSAVIEQKRVVAPFDGRLGLRTVEKGQFVPAGQGLVWLQSLDPIWVDFPVPETQAGKIEIGDAVTVRTDTFPGKSFKGKLIARDIRVATETRTLTLRAELPNPDRLLLPGMYGNVSVASGGAQDYVTVPKTAVTYSLYGDSVWVVVPKKAEKPQPKPGEAQAAANDDAGKDEDAKGGETAEDAKDPKDAKDAPAEPELEVERHFVRVGPTQGDRVAILEGIAAGDEVVTSGQLKLQPGSAVKVDNAERLKAPPELPRP